MESSSDATSTTSARLPATQHLKSGPDDFKGKGLDEITRPDVEAYQTAVTAHVSEHTGRLLSPRSVNYAVTTLKGLFTRAIRDGLANHNPVKGVEMLQENNIQDRWLDAKEIQALLEACESGPPHLKSFVSAGVGLGMRLGELKNLRWGDLDFSTGMVRVETEKARGNEIGKRLRYIPMNAMVRESLRSCISVDQIVDGKSGAEQGDDFVFRGPGGKPLKDIRGSFKAALNRAGITGKVTFHTLRHSFASHLASNGVDVLVIRDLLGHTNLNTTLRYAKLNPDRKRAAVDLVPGSAVTRGSRLPPSS